MHWVLGQLLRQHAELRRPQPSVGRWESPKQASGYIHVPGLRPQAIPPSYLTSLPDFQPLGYQKGVPNLTACKDVINRQVLGV